MVVLFYFSNFTWENLTECSIYFSLPEKKKCNNCVNKGVLCLTGKIT